MHSINPDPPLKARHEGAYFLILLAASLFLYRDILGAGFISDDFSIIGKFIERGMPHFYFSEFFRPLGLLSLWIDLQLFGTEPLWYRLENFFLHAVNCWLVYLLARQIAGVHYEIPARIAGLVFALFPAHSEVLFWISCRFDLLATCFVLLCLISYLKWLDKPHFLWMTTYLLCLLAAFLSKESAFALPLLILVVTLTKKNPQEVIVIAKKYPLFVGGTLLVLALQFFLRWISIGQLLGGTEYPEMSLADYWHNLAAFSYRTLFFPTDTPLPESMGRRYLSRALAFSPLVLMILASSDSKNKKLYLLIPLAFIVSLMPVLHARIQLFSIGNERYTYLAGVWACVFIALLLRHPFFYPGALRRGIAAILIIGYLALCVYTLPDSLMRWKTASTIANESMDILSKESNGKPFLVLGLPDEYKGAYILHNGLPRGLKHFYNAPPQSIQLQIPFKIDINESDLVINATQNGQELTISHNGIYSRFIPGQNAKDYALSISKRNVSILLDPETSKEFQYVIFCRNALRPIEHCAAQ